MTKNTKERPILFNGEMVRAILEGRKTMTRRIIKPAPQMVTDHKIEPWDGDPAALMRLLESSGRCPFGAPGDRLWVRETWGVGSRPDQFGGYDGIEYRADVAYLDEFDLLHCRAIDDVDLSEYRSGWHPSIHMPRWASRILLEITAVRVERLSDTSGDDARAEGYPDRPVPGAIAKLWFSELWEKINGAGSWAENPWVWVVEFKSIEVTA